MVFDFLKSRWVLIAVVTLFVMFKIPHLLYPFYWDECWPYVPAIKEMARHGISLMPNAIDAELSRGHPLFFHAAGAMWIHIFGPSDFSLHCFALAISVLFLVTVFEAAYRIFNERAAVITLLLVAMHVSFFVQSSFVLFEMLVAFLSFLSIYLYVQKRYFFTTLALTALFLTKESGLIAGFVIGVDALISLFNTKTAIKERIIKLLPVTIACMMMGLFFLLQKHIRGWYVFPLYSGTILNKWSDIWFRFGTGVLNTVFCHDYGYIIFLFFILYTIIMVIKGRTVKNIMLLSVIILAVICYYAGYYPDIYLLNFDAKDPFLPTLCMFLVFVGFYLLAVFSFSKARLYTDNKQTKLIVLVGMFALCFMLFSSTAYFIPRYLLPAIVAVLFVAGVLFDMLIRHSYKALYYPLLVIIAVSSLFSFKRSRGYSDIDRCFITALKTHTAVVEFMERSNLYNKRICTSSFLEKEHLIDPNTGFLTTNKAFTHVDFDIDSSDYIIFDNIESEDSRHDMIAKSPAYELVYMINYDQAWAEIYKKK